MSCALVSGNFISSQSEVRMISLVCRLRCLPPLHFALIEIPWTTEHKCSLSVQERHHFQTVSGDDNHRIFLFRLLLLSQALILVLRGWQVSGARAPGLWLEAPGEFHAHPSLVSHRFCHFPLLSIRAALSPREELCSRRLPGQRGAESSKLHACQPLHWPRGPPGAPLKRLPGQDATTKTETFCFATHNAHGWEARRGETSGAALCRQEEQLRPSLQT